MVELDTTTFAAGLRTALLDATAFESHLCRFSFYDFVLHFWDTVVPDPYVGNWHIEFLCNELQTMAERVFRGEPYPYDLIVNIPPGTTKSLICSIMFPAWVWARMPAARFICGSYAYDLALDLSRKCRDVIQSERYVRLFGDVQLRDDQNTKGAFANSAGGERFATSTGGNVTGRHGHFILVDDPLNPKEAASDVELTAANRWLEETLPTRKVDKLVCPTILIMQRLHVNDPTGALLEKAARGTINVRHVCLPAELGGRAAVRPRALKANYVDGLLDPRRMPRPVLARMREALAEYGYAGQFDQSPIPRGGGMFRVDMFVIVPDPGKVTKAIRFWDKAGSVKKGAKYTVGVKLGMTADRRVVVMDVVRGQWEAAERERMIKNTAIMDGKAVLVGVEQEPGSGGLESAQNTVRNLMGWRVKLDRPTGDKTDRADPYAYQVNSGNVQVVNAIWTKAYIEELRYFPMLSTKDQVDSSSGAFNMLAKVPRLLGAL